MFDSTLSWSDTCQKMAYYLHLINHHRHVLPSYLIKLLLDSLVMSHMQYALSVWGPSLTQNQLLHLQRLQNCAVWLVFSLNRSNHISGYYYELHLLKVCQLIQFHSCSISIMQSGGLCLRYLKCLRTILCITSELHHTYFANSMRTCLSQTQKQARPQGTIIWNNLPSELKEPISYINFYDATYAHFLSLLWFLYKFFLHVYLLCMYNWLLCLCFVLWCVHCVCTYVSVPPMRKSGSAEVKLSIN